MTTTVYCIRHGETDWNATGRWQGRAPIPLNAAGREQAETLARWLAAHGPQFAALYSSPNARAWQTAEAIARAVNLRIQPDPGLQEVDLGDWQGLTRDEVAAWDPEQFARFDADYYAVPPPNGESRNDLKVRARATFDTITAQHTGHTIALVSHGGTLGMLIESLFGKIDRPSLANTSITILAQANPADPWQLARVAWLPHLDGPAIGETW